MTSKRVQGVDVSSTDESVIVTADYDCHTGITNVLSTTKISTLRREFKNWIPAVRLLKWLKRHPHCQVFDLDDDILSTRIYTGRLR